VLENLIVKIGLLDLGEEFLERLELEQLLDRFEWLEANEGFEWPEGERNLRLVVCVGELVGVFLVELRGEVFVL
jgi:hypothetical protein